MCLSEGRWKMSIVQMRLSEVRWKMSIVQVCMSEVRWTNVYGTNASVRCQIKNVYSTNVSIRSQIKNDYSTNVSVRRKKMSILQMCPSWVRKNVCSRIVNVASWQISLPAYQDMHKWSLVQVDYRRSASIEDLLYSSNRSLNLWNASLQHVYVYLPPGTANEDFVRYVNIQ